MSTFSNPSKDSPKPQNPDFPEKVIKDIYNQTKKCYLLGAYPSLPPHSLSPGQAYSIK